MIKKEWPGRKALKPGNKDVAKETLVDSSRNLLPPLYIVLGLMKQVVTALSTLIYLGKEFPKLSEAKLKVRVLVGRDIRKLFRDEVSESESEI